MNFHVFYFGFELLRRARSERAALHLFNEKKSENNGGGKIPLAAPTA
jgi:hypothetical protein